jgi:hypothetical protein
MSNQPVDALIQQLQHIIASGRLELLDRYPNDLLVHDRLSFERFWAPGQRFGWMVGHSHTHVTALGLHPDENKSVTYVLNLSSTDRFFEITVGRDETTFRIEERGRDAYAALQRVPVDYRKVGVDNKFDVYRANNRVGHVTVEASGPYTERIYKAVLTPTCVANKADKAALHVWADHAARSIAGTLFFRSQYLMNDPILDLLHAA